MTDITASELKERIENKETINLIDVREQWEYDEKNLGAKLIPLGTLPQRVAEIEGLKDQEVIVHCKLGGRSAQAQAYLKQQGFSNVRNLIGGIEGYLK